MYSEGLSIRGFIFSVRNLQNKAHKTRHKQKEKALPWFPKPTDCDMLQPESIE